MADLTSEAPETAAKTLEIAQEAVMVKSVPVPEGTPIVKGYDFNKGRDLDGIMAAAMTTGFQVCGCGSGGSFGADSEKSLASSWGGQHLS